MASRSFLPQVWSLLKGVTLIRARILMSGTTPLLQKFSYPNNAPNSSTLGVYANASTTGGGTTWPSQNQQGAEGVRSVARTGAGLWTFVLQDNYQRLLDIGWYETIAGGTANIVTVAENSSISSMSTAGGSTIGIALLSSTATVADPDATGSVTLTFILQNASEP
jgi:hypothetical protein